MIGFPLLLIPLAIYNIIVLLMPGVSFADPLLRLTLVSGAEWAVTLSDLLLALGILMLLLEVFKGARPGAKYLTDHLLSLILFGAAAAEFVLWPKFGTSTYFLLVLLALTDFLSGVVLRAQRGMPAAQAAGVPLQRASRKADMPRSSLGRGELSQIRSCARAAGALRSPNPCRPIIPSRALDKPGLRSPRPYRTQPRRKPPRRKFLRQNCSRAMARTPRQRRRRINRLT